MNQNRPATSKARGICRYYDKPRGCYAGDGCKFLHTDPAQHPEESGPLLTPYDRAKRCKFYVRGFCKRAEKCWFVHDTGDGLEKEDCSICFEKPTTYGLLSGCSHIFCISCIRQWREAKPTFADFPDNVKKCPMCRTTSQFVTPSSKFWKEGDEGKTVVTKAYMDSMSRVPCKYLQLSKIKDPARPACPFGKDCFYQHLNDDGTSCVLTDGIDVSMRRYIDGRYLRNTGGFNFQFGIPMGGPTNSNGGEMDAMDLAGNIAIDIVDRMVAETQRSGITGGRRRGRASSGRRGIDEATLNHARFQMVAGAIEAIRVEIGRLEGLTNRGGGEANHRTTGNSERGRGGRLGGGDRPVIVPETLAPSLWDLDVMDGMASDNDDIRGGWGWNNLFSDISIGAESGDAAVLERLEILAEHMLASLQSMGRESESEGSHDGDTTPPPLEPLPRRDDSIDGTSRPGTPLLESVERTSSPRHRGQSDVHANEFSGDDDDLPSLESVSNFSLSEDGQSSNVGGGGVQPRLDQTVRAFDLAFRRSRSLEASPERTHSWPLSRFWGGARRLVEAALSEYGGEDPDPPPTATSSQRFSTVVGRDLEQTIIDINDNDDEGDQADSLGDSGGEDQDDYDARHYVSSANPSSQEPPFMTDGRGRVIWSSSGTNKADPAGLTAITNSHPIPHAPSSDHPMDAGDEPSHPRSLIGRVLGSFF